MCVRQQQLTLENSSAELRLEKARGALRLAEIQLEELKKGPRPEEVDYEDHFAAGLEAGKTDI